LDMSSFGFPLVWHQ